MKNEAEVLPGGSPESRACPCGRNKRRKAFALASILCPPVGILLTILLSGPIARALHDGEWGFGLLFVSMIGSAVSVLTGLVLNIVAWIRGENRVLAILGLLVIAAPFVFIAMAPRH